MVGKGVEIDFSGFERLNAKLTVLAHAGEFKKVRRRTLRKLAQVYIRTAKENTPVGEFKEVEQDGQIYRTESEHMRRSWEAGRIGSKKKVARIPVFNTASYASYVNDGHRQTPGRYVPILGKRLVKGFVDGLNMAEKAAAATEKSAYDILDAEITTHLRKWTHDTH